VESRHSAAATGRRLGTAENVSERVLEEFVGEAVDDGVDSTVGVAEDGEQLDSVDLPSVQWSDVIRLTVGEVDLPTQQTQPDGKKK